MNKPEAPFHDPRDDAILALAERVGARVRAAREARGLSRRRLAEMSDVSQRYLAQIEMGQGNISIALLYRVADALGQRIEWLVSPHAPDIEGQRVEELFRVAAPDKRTNVLEMLSSEASAMRARRVALIGLRGAGKSTLGARLAQTYGARFVELNDEIEDLCGMRVADLIALYGQEGYRRLENEALTRLADSETSLVLAVAGGVVSQAGAFNNLLDRFHTIWLKAAPEEHMARVRAQGDERPMSGNPAAMDQLRSILTSREDQYRMAAATLNTSAQSVDDALAALIDLVSEKSFLD